MSVRFLSLPNSFNINVLFLRKVLAHSHYFSSSSSSSSISYLSLQNFLHFSSSFRRMNRGDTNRGGGYSRGRGYFSKGSDNTPQHRHGTGIKCDDDEQISIPKVSNYQRENKGWSTYSGSISISSKDHECSPNQLDSRQLVDSNSKRRSFHMERLQRGQMSKERAMSSNFREPECSPLVDSAHEEECYTLSSRSGSMDRSSNIKKPHNHQRQPMVGFTHEEEWSSLSSLNSSMNRSSNTRTPQNHQRLPEREACSKSIHSASSHSVGSLTSPRAFSGRKDRPSHTERSQDGQNSPQKAVGNSSSEHSESSFDLYQIKTAIPFKLNVPLHKKNKEKRKERERSKVGLTQKILRPGMVLLKHFITESDQIKIIEKCRELGLSPGGFYRPGFQSGAELHLQMMCLGKNWDPETRSYGDQRATDNAKPPSIPDEFKQLVEQAIKASHARIKQDSEASSVEDILPGMSPDICIVNFYANNGRLGLHQDRDESSESLMKGLPVVSFSIGYSAEFLYGDNRDVDKAEKVVLESGDVLIFGGKSRHVFHGVPSILPDSAPSFLDEKTKLRPGRLNLTFRQY